MTSKLLSRGNINVVLLYAMGVFLALAVIGGTISLVWSKQVLGNDAGLAADASAWLYTAAFLTVFVLALSEQRRRSKAHQLG